LSGPAYNEAFSPGAFDVSIRDHGATRDFFVRHDYMQDPIGAVTFQRSAEGLMFDALVSKTQRGDEYLELCRDGAMRSVSVGFIPVPGKTFTRSVAGTNAQYRTEAILKELSLTPTGFGQYPQSQVLAIRDALEHDAEELEASRTLRSAELARFARMGHRLGIALGEKTPAETV
jgi:HK97 family phage prohead protease